MTANTAISLSGCRCESAERHNTQTQPRSRARQRQAGPLNLDDLGGPQRFCSKLTTISKPVQIVKRGTDAGLALQEVLLFNFIYKCHGGLLGDRQIWSVQCNTPGAAIAQPCNCHDGTYLATVCANLAGFFCSTLCRVALNLGK